MLNAFSRRWASPPQSRTVSAKKPSASIRTRSVRWSAARGADGDAMPAPVVILASAKSLTTRGLSVLACNQPEAGCTSTVAAYSYSGACYRALNRGTRDSAGAARKPAVFPRPAPQISLFDVPNRRNIGWHEYYVVFRDRL